MWLVQPIRLLIFLGVCVVIIGMFLEVTEARGLMKQQSQNTKRRQSMLGRKRKAMNKKSKQMKKQKSRQRNKKQPARPKPPKAKAPDNTKISVYKCPSEAVEMNCLSCRTKVYRKCPIAGATKITRVQVMKEYPSSYEKCNVGRRENFGIEDDSNIWVNYGCRAKFLVCYEKGKHEPKTINCMCTTSKHKCPTGLQGIRLNIDIKVTILWSFGTQKCREGQNWGYNKDDIWVDHGCSATFRVLW
ncbi:lectin ADEL-like isoform X2 [Mercenaria mercenaria]|uniref:lectin ADEL-like isoform X2 n=1 Tax=Mercenaria mercenaria TaxID=6596 RepID=UPI00234F4878|nr:lectin ADEL-like isoform X2 [Mercenaria mercenaria]